MIIKRRAISTAFFNTKKSTTFLMMAVLQQNERLLQMRVHFRVGKSPTPPNIADSFNGRTRDFDSCNCGSTPQSVANDKDHRALFVSVKCGGCLLSTPQGIVISVQ